jgi:PAS domain S-box-containing protein
MRLADFILDNIEPILAEWEVFARGIWPGVATDPTTLRDHAEEILRAMALDMKSDQTTTQQSDKSKGEGPDDQGGGSINSASVLHAVARAESKFQIATVIAEYRALRASVIRLWRESSPNPNVLDLDDLTRFNESIDQSLTEAARGFTARSDVIANRLAAIIKSSDDAIVSKGLDGIITSWNHAAERIFGYTASEAIGQHITLIIPPEKRPEEEDVLSRLRRGEVIDHFQTVRRAKDGRRLDISVTISPIRDSSDRIIGASKVARDITAQKRSEEALRVAQAEAEDANRAKDIFLATLSHELRTPLNAIVGWISILRAKGSEDEDMVEGLAVIERNTKAQVQLIEDVLDVSRIVSGKLRLEMRPCELVEIINAGIDVVRPGAEARNITLDVQLDPAANRVTCDATRIQQVIWNLVSNAIKFTPKGGTIRVTLTRDQSSLQVEVSDNGQGISPELLPFVFDRFRQADSSSRRKFGGLGLGLSIVKHLVEMHGGTVVARSPGEGLGSTFIVRLPVRAVQMPLSPDDAVDDDVQGATPALPLVRLDGLRVLVVDDEADARRLLVKVLEGVGANVTAAGSVAEALEALAKKPSTRGVEVLVSDLGMPDKDGYDLIREVRRRGFHAKDLPAVALTAFVHKDDAREAVLAGFQVHIPKPVDPHDLTAIIASLAGRTG